MRRRARAGRFSKGHLNQRAMPQHAEEPYIPRELDREFALAVRAALTSGEPDLARLRELVSAVVNVLRTQGAEVGQILDAMEDAVAAVLAARVSGGYHTPTDPNAPTPAAVLADQVRLMTSDVLHDMGVRPSKSRSVSALS